MCKLQKHATCAQPVPIWLAALFAIECRATCGNRHHVVPWDCVSGRAIYTNDGATAEIIEPLAVSLERGETLAVSWRPGETGYTMEIYGRSQMVA